MILRPEFIPSDDKSIFHDRIFDEKHQVVANVYDLHEQNYTKLFVAAPDLLDFVIQYLYSEHGICDPEHDAAPYMPEELKEMAQAAIHKTTE